MGLFFAAALFVIAASAASAADADLYSSCTERNGHDDNLLRELYSYALFVEAADNGRLPDWQCEATDTQSTWRQRWQALNGQPSNFQRLSMVDLKESGWDEIAQSFRARGRHIGAYERERGGPVYVVCDNNPTSIKLFLTWSRIRANFDVEGFLSSVVVPVVLAIDFLEGTTTQEGLRTVAFHRNGDLSIGEEDYYPETVTAVPGTDLTMLRELQTSWNDFHGKSCIFDFMVAIAGGMWSRTNELYAFAGHSLGGSVAQYVAQKLAPADDTANGANFQAYAYNAVGLDESRGANPKTLHSFYVEGDPVVGLGTYKGRIQGGRVVRYTPPPTTHVWSKLENLWEKATFKWHRLPAVQEGLCDCMNGRGELGITNWSATRGN